MRKIGSGGAGVAVAGKLESTVAESRRRSESKRCNHATEVFSGRYFKVSLTTTIQAQHKHLENLL